MICDGVLRKLSNSATQRGNFKTPTIMLYNAMFRMTWFIIAKLRGVGVAHLFILFFLCCPIMRLYILSSVLGDRVAQ